MKVFLRILILLQIIVLFVGCTNKDISPLLYKDEVDPIPSQETANNLNYTIDKITLSKNYQSIEPNIEILKSGLDSKILLSLGIVESTGVSVDKIDKDGRDINIYIQNKKKNNKEELVVPQIIVNFQDLSPKDLEDLNFKIINENYEPIRTNLDIGEAINKIKSSFKIATSTLPNSTIKKDDEDIILDLDFVNVVDLKDKENPIIDLNVLINLSNGKILNSNKSSVSSLIDEGDILDYIPNKYIIYLKEEIENDLTNYNLWIYDIKKDSKVKFYTSNRKINCLKFNDLGDKAFIIESSESSNKLSILKLNNLKSYKIKLDKKINLSSAFWKNDDLFLTDKNNNITKIYNLNISNNKVKLVSTVDKDIRQIQYFNNKFIFTIQNDKTEEIYITEDFKDNTLIDRGEKPLFVDENTVAYLKNDKDTGKDILWFYCPNSESIKPYPDIDVLDYFMWKENLAIIERTPIGSENPLYIYNLKDEKTNFIASVKSNKIFLNTEKDILYINSSIDVGDEKTSVISFLSLENYKTPQNLD